MFISHKYRDYINRKGFGNHHKYVRDTVVQFAIPPPC